MIKIIINSLAHCIYKLLKNRQRVATKEKESEEAQCSEAKETKRSDTKEAKRSESEEVECSESKESEQKLIAKKRTDSK